MATSTVRWIGGKQFAGIDSTHHSVVLPTADENVGREPSELLLVALAFCTAMEGAIRLSEEKYCPVAATVRDVAEISYSFEILD